jgi:hypothetical protein
MDAGRAVLGHDDIAASRADEISSSEVHRQGELSSENDVPGTIRRDRKAEITAGAPEALAPLVHTRRIVFRQINLDG